MKITPTILDFIHPPFWLVLIIFIVSAEFKEIYRPGSRHPYSNPESVNSRYAQVNTSTKKFTATEKIPHPGIRQNVHITIFKMK
jgi:hypothetical protein